MKKIKIFPAPHLEIRVHVSDEMVRDYRACREELIESGLPFVDCSKCSWRDVKMTGERMCELDVMEHLLEEKS